MKRITPKIRGYASRADRERAIKQLFRKGWNHFVCFRDVQSEFALQYGLALWAGNSPYILR